MNRNGFRLIGKLAWRGYEWWWHSLVGMSKHSGDSRPFFIEYFVINPALGGEEPILGQLEENQQQGIRPSYAMLKAGSWGQNAVEINNFYGIRDFSASVTQMDVSPALSFLKAKQAYFVTPEDLLNNCENVTRVGMIEF